MPEHVQVGAGKRERYRKVCKARRGDYPIRALRNARRAVQRVRAQAQQTYFREALFFHDDGFRSKPCASPVPPHNEITHPIAFDMPSQLSRQPGQLRPAGRALPQEEANLPHRPPSFL